MHFHECMHRYFCTCHVAILKERFVEVAKVGIGGIVGLEVGADGIGVAVEIYGAAFLYGEVLDNDVLEGEAVSAFEHRICPVDSKVFI